MKTAGLALIALLAACGGPVARQVANPSASTPVASPLPSAVASSTLPPASPSPIPPSKVGFSCRLPFLQQTGTNSWQAGFITFPTATFVPDPGAPSTPGYYDRAVSRWLPVGRSAVAPDGLHYALISGGSPAVSPGPPRLHIVDAATGVERVLDLALPDTNPYGVEDYRNDGIYIGSSWEGGFIGRWRVDPATGRAVAIAADLLLDDGTAHAWHAVVDARDPNPAHSVMDGQPLPNEIVRRDLKTGADAVWFYHPGFSLAVAGVFVDGGLLVWAEADTMTHPDSAHEYWVVGAPGRSQLIARLELGGQTMSDAHGIWMGAAGGLYLITRDGAIHQVYGVSGDPENGCF